MSSGFLKFKKRSFVEALIKGIMSGLSVGLLFVATFLTLIKLKLSDFSLVYSILIGVALALIVGFVVFFIVYPSDKRLAKRLDNRLGLNEKVQTMVAFKDVDGDITQLQREDANNKLVNTASSQLKLKCLWIYILVLVLSIAFMVTAIVIPAKVEPDVPPVVDTPPVDDTPPKVEFDPNEHHKKGIQQLIEYVQKSDLTEDAKTLVVVELLELLAEIDKFEYVDEMESFVIKTIKDIQKIVNNTNGYPLLVDKTKDSKNKLLLQLSLAYASIDETTYTTAIQTIETAFLNSEELLKDMKELSSQLSTAVSSAGLDEENEFYLVSKKLSDKLADLVKKLEDEGATEIGTKNKLIEAFDTALDEYTDLLSQQIINNEVCDYVVKELINLFGIDPSKLESNKGPTTELPSEDDEQQGDDGGLGTGELLFGSNDIIFDPEGNVCVKYGDVFGRYDAKISEMIKDGVISEELGELLTKYFDALSTPPSKE